MIGNFKISTKLTVSLLLLIGFPILINSYLNFKTARDTFQKQILGDLSLVAEVEEGYLLEFLEGARKRVVDFSSDGFIRDSVKKIYLQEEESTELLNSHLIRNKKSLDDTIYGINVFNLDGLVISSTDSREIGASGLHGHDDHDFLSASDLSYGESHLSDIYNVPHFGVSADHFVAAAPLTDKDTGEKIGVIVNYIKLEDLNKTLTGKRDEELGSTSERGRRDTFEVYLVNSDSMMISESRFIPNAVLRQKVDTVPVQECNQGHEMTGIYPDYRGVSIIGASICLTNGWTLLAEIDESEAFGGLDAIKRNAITIAGLLLFGVILLIYIIVRQITKPIKELSNAAKNISEGDLSQSVAVRNKDEIGLLAESFNVMAKNLHESRSNIEQKIEERTSDLEQLNRSMTGRELKMIELKKEIEELKNKK
jgi:HAMP domain-containing protein